MSENAWTEFLDELDLGPLEEAPIQPLEGVIADGRTYRIFADGDVDYLFRLTMDGKPFHCRICGRNDRWRLDSPTTFICNDDHDAGFSPVQAEDIVLVKFVKSIQETDNE